MRDIQRHPVRRDVTHIDFLAVDPDQPVTVDVPVVIGGLEEGDDGADLTVVTHNLSVAAKPAALPNEIVVDGPAAREAGSLRLGDIELPEGVTTEADPELVLVEVVSTEILALPEDEVEEAAEGRGGRGGRGGVRGARRGRRQRRERRRLTGAAGAAHAAQVPVVPTATSATTAAGGGPRQPGAEYARSRHNVGAEVVELLASRHGGRLRSTRDQALVDEVRLDGRRVRAGVPPDLHERLGPLGARCSSATSTSTTSSSWWSSTTSSTCPSGRCGSSGAVGWPATTASARCATTCTAPSSCGCALGVGKPPTKERGADHVLRRMPKADREVLDVVVRARRRRGRGDRP